MKTQRSRVKRWIGAGLALSLFVPLLAACNAKDHSNDPNNRHTLRIGTIYGSKQDESWFRQQYTDLFEFSHPNIDIEIVPAIDYSEQQFEQPQPNQKQPDPVEKAKEIMTGANPVDVMMLDSSTLTALVRENLLVQLDPLLKEDKIDLNAFVPTVIEGIKDMGDGNLYALTPTFNPSALFYNKKAFQKAGVTDLPHDGMTWDDVFNLARRLKQGTGKDATYGFTFNSWGGGDGFYDIQTYAAPLQLRMYDEKGEKMTVNTPQWEKVWTTIADLYKNHILPQGQDLQVDPPKDNTVNNPYYGRPFFNGKVAMTIADYSMVNDLITFNNNADKLKMDKIDWDVVTVPFHPEVPNVSGNIYLNQLTAINAKAQNKDDAWEFVKFMNSEETAKLKSRSYYEMPSRKDFIKPKDGASYNVAAFYTMKPAPQMSAEDQALQREKPNIGMVNQIGSQEFQQVLDNKKTVKEALAEWETKGNDLLQKIKANPNGPIEGVFDDVYGKGAAMMAK
jgi:multiple sugar transport system substrate-binding protein